MKRTPPETAPDDLALWRYSIISALLHRDPEGKSMAEVLADLAGQTWVRPGGGRIQVSPETLRKWLYRYRVGGLNALADQSRADKGSTRVPSPLQDELFALRRQHPRWTLAIIFAQLLQQGRWNGSVPGRSALYRFCQAHHLQRDPARPTAACRSFAYDLFGQLWVADFLHGPKLWHGQRKATIYLHAILDDATRYIVAAAFHLAENVEALLADFLAAIRRHGIPHRFYSDNGAAFRSRHLALVGARLGVQLPHTPPYTPQGRGKVERFLQTVRTRFLDVQHFKTVDEINPAFQQWLAQYHATPHAALGEPPLQRRLAVASVCRQVPAVTPLEALFRMERRCRVYKDGTVRLYGHCFELPDAVPGRRVTVYYLPWDLAQIHYGDEFRVARPLDRAANARRPRRPAAADLEGAHEQ